MRRLFVADVPTAEPNPAELVVWIGPLQPPDRIVREREVVRLRNEQDAIAFITARSPVQLRVQLDRPLSFLRALATTSDKASAA